MPKVPPGQVARLPYWLETCADTSHPCQMEKGRRCVAYPCGERPACQAMSAVPGPLAWTAV